VTISGTNFGNDSSVIQVTINGVQQSGVSVSTAFSTIQFTAQAGTGLKNDLQVSVNGQLTSVANFAYAAPTISGLTTSTNGSTAGGILTLTGTNLGNDLSVLSVYLAGSQIPSVSSVNHTQAIFPFPAGTGANKPLLVSVDGQNVSTTFSYASPSVAQVTPSATTAGGVSTLLGSNFGTISLWPTSASMVQPSQPRPSPSPTVSLPSQPLLAWEPTLSPSQWMVRHQQASHMYTLLPQSLESRHPTSLEAPEC